METDDQIRALPLNSQPKQVGSNDDPPSEGSYNNNMKFDDEALRSYVTPYLLKQEEINRVHTNDNVRTEVEEIVSFLVNFMKKGNNPFFHNGDYALCGSVAEGTKVGNNNEFDYRYIVEKDGCHFERSPLLRTKPLHSSHKSKSFYKLSLGGVEILAKDIHNEFVEVIAAGMREYKAEKHPNGKVVQELKKAGPAVKIVLNPSLAGSSVKIDLTFGIRCRVADVFDDNDLTDLGSSLLKEDKLPCHAVMAHDYWKISFTEVEGELMKQISEDREKVACYRAIKAIRDQVDIKDQYGDGILPSYPIKMTFMDIALHEETEWKWTNLGQRTIEILKAIEERGGNHQLTGLFIRDEHIMAESDRSYLESRRVLKELFNCQTKYCKQSRMHKKHDNIQLLSRYVMIVAFLAVIHFRVFVPKVKEPYVYWPAFLGYVYNFFIMVPGLFVPELKEPYGRRPESWDDVEKRLVGIRNLCLLFITVFSWVFHINDLDEGYLVDVGLIFPFSDQRIIEAYGDRYSKQRPKRVCIIKSIFYKLVPALFPGLIYLLNYGYYLKNGVKLYLDHPLHHCPFLYTWEWTAPDGQGSPYTIIAPELPRAGRIFANVLSIISELLLLFFLIAITPRDGYFGYPNAREHDLLIVIFLDILTGLMIYPKIGLCVDTIRTLLSDILGGR